MFNLRNKALDFVNWHQRTYLAFCTERRYFFASFSEDEEDAACQ